jgi:hypothetical protein
MSVYSTHKLADRLMEIHSRIMSVPPTGKASELVDALTWLAHAIASPEYCYLPYFAPEIRDALVQRLTDYENLVEDVSEEYHMTDGACMDMELELQEALQAAEEACLPVDSFFFAYKDKEYFSLKIDAQGNLVEEFRGDQRMADGHVYGCLREWYQEHGLAVGSIEVAVCMDAVDSRFPCGDGEHYPEEY